MTDEDQWDVDLKPKERLFALHYCTDDKTFLNATASYKATYTKIDKATGQIYIPDDTTAAANGCKLTKKPRVKLAIRKLLKLAQAELDEENTYKILKELVNLSLFNPADILDATGDLVTDNLKDLGIKALAIAQIQPTQFGTRYTLVDRSVYMSLLTKYLDLTRDEQKVEINLPVMEVAPKAVSDEEWNAAAEQEE